MSVGKARVCSQSMTQGVLNRFIWESVCTVAISVNVLRTSPSREQRYASPIRSR
jgi:hypothetical protein